MTSTHVKSFFRPSLKVKKIFFKIYSTYMFSAAGNEKKCFGVGARPKSGQLRTPSYCRVDPKVHLQLYHTCTGYMNERRHDTDLFVLDLFPLSLELFLLCLVCLPLLPPPPLLGVTTRGLLRPSVRTILYRNRKRIFIF